MYRWSGRVDLNHRPSAPKADALTRLRYFPSYLNYINFPKFATSVIIHMFIFVGIIMFERFISFRYLKSNKGFTSVVTWFSFLGILLGVATLIIVTSVMNGFQEDLLSRIIGMKGHIVVISKQNNDVTDYEKVVPNIISNNLVLSAIPIIEKQAVLMNKGSARGVMINSFSPSDLEKKTLISKNIIAGDAKSFAGNNILMGSRLAEILRIRIGESISLMIPGGVITPFGSIPKQESFLVSGIFKAGMIDYDKNIVVMPLNSAQKFFNMENSVSQIDVFVKDIDNTDKITQSLQQKFADNYKVCDWKHSDSSIFHAVKVEKNVMILILSIIILVAVFNIISGLTMLTNNKVRDIAILRTMGASQASILKIFFIIGSSIGVIGTTFGVLIGVMFATNIDKIKTFLEKFSDSPLFHEEIYFLSQIPSKIDYKEVIIITLFSLILCFIATIYPAKKAAKLDPAEALRI